MKIKRGDATVINDYSKVTVTKMNHLVEVQYLARKNTNCSIKKLDSDHYMMLETGEIREYNHIENRQGSLNSLSKTFKRLRYLINNNFVGSPNELHVTLTYKENMTDSERLYDDCRKFFMRLKYAYKSISSIDYISVVEPQERGAWHCHVLMRFNDVDEIFIENSKMRELWGNGFVTIKSLKHIDNIGAYLSAYLADIELTDENLIEHSKQLLDGLQVQEKLVDGKEKKFIKGGRLYMYPPGMQLYRKSKGILPPDRDEMSYEDAKKIVRSAKPHFTKTYEMYDENQEHFNTLIYEQYNLKRV